MTAVIHLFARARDVAGAAVVTLDVGDDPTVADVRARLAGRYPAMAELLARSAFARNHDFCPDDAPVAPGDELAVIPPVSGG